MKRTTAGELLNAHVQSALMMTEILASPEKVKEIAETIAAHPLPPQSVCGWHRQHFPDEPTPILKAGDPENLSHGICPRCNAIAFPTVSPAHKAIVDEIVAARESEAKPEVLHKPQEQAGAYSTRTNGRRQMVVSKKQEPTTYFGIDI